MALPEHCSPCVWWSEQFVSIGWQHVNVGVSGKGMLILWPTSVGWIHRCDEFIV